jgi:hypothetical protein
VPPDFISADGFGITEAARRYSAPLIVGEAFPPFRNGLPAYVRLQNVAVPKKLARLRDNDYNRYTACISPCRGVTNAAVPRGRATKGGARGGFRTRRWKNEACDPPH